MSFGGFGFNYAAVGPVRESALDYLDFVLEGDGRPALLAVGILEGLLHSYLNRVGRAATDMNTVARSGAPALSSDTPKSLRAPRDSPTKGNHI